MDTRRKHSPFVLRFPMRVYHLNSKNGHVVCALSRLFIVLNHLCALRSNAPLYGIDSQLEQ